MIHDKKILRLIDANANRLIEGLRVCEEIMRFIAADKQLTLKFKQSRHRASSLIKDWEIKKKSLLGSRDSLKDVGRPSIVNELVRKDHKNIFFANIQRAKESSRVLEEFSKLNRKKISEGFKSLRYNLYQFEKQANSRL